MGVTCYGRIVLVYSTLIAVVHVWRLGPLFVVEFADHALLRLLQLLLVEVSLAPLPLG